MKNRLRNLLKGAGHWKQRNLLHFDSPLPTSDSITLWKIILKIGFWKKTVDCRIFRQCFFGHRDSWINYFALLELFLTGEPLLIKLPINCKFKFRLKWLSHAKLKSRSEASRQKLKFEIFWREATLRALSFASLGHFKRNGQLICHFNRLFLFIF